MEIKNVTVIGAGAMGNGIAQVSAQAGYQVKLNDISTEFLDKAMKTITKSLDRMVEKGKKTAVERDQILGCIQTTTDLAEAVQDADLVIEAVFENLDLKKEIFKKIDDLAPAEALFGSNTSTLPIAAMAGVTRRLDKFLGLHFMNPVPVMKGIEVIRGSHTSNETMELVLDYIKTLGKDPAVAVDYAGFIVSRILNAAVNEAALCVMNGNSPEEIDKAMRICANWPMGPCELSDLVGVEISLSGIETLQADFGNRWLPAPLLKQMVRSGDLGRKAGRGFYKYKD